MNDDYSTVANEGRTNKKGFTTHLLKTWIMKPFPKLINAPYGNERMTVIVLRGTLAVALCLTLLLIVNGVLVEKVQGIRIAIGLVICLYLGIAELLTHHKKYLTVAWMLLGLYAFFATIILLVWSLNTPFGILTISFTVLLAGALLRPKHILTITFLIIAILCIVQYIHSASIITPDLEPLSRQSQFMDVIAYATIIAIFALISWLSGKQTEHSIHRALLAEDKIKAEKVNLVRRLEEQSIELRQIQLQEMASLYKFAAIGQSTTATLHELSNQLSILSLDIDDLQLRHSQSTAIQNAKEGIESINVLVRQTRKQLQDNREQVRFNAIPIIERTIKELQPKLRTRNVVLHKSILNHVSFQLLGDPSNLSHVLTILIKNASDACSNTPNARVEVTIEQDNDELKISINDNGPGLSLDTNRLFVPHKSSKPNGLGIGLYITKQIIENQFKGKIHAKKLQAGTRFTISLPRTKKE